MKKWGFWCLLVFLFSHALVSAAEESVELGEVIVTATRTPEPAKQVPVAVEVITREEIEASGAKSLDELLAEYHPGHLHKYPGLLSTVRIRGFASGDAMGNELRAGVLILIDGHRAGTGNIAAIPLENVERIEIVKGPGSVMYGSAAMGGVINIITRKGAGKPTATINLEYGSWNTLKVKGNMSGGLVNNKIGISMSGRTVQQNEDFEVGEDGTRDNTKYNDDAFSLSLSFRPSNNHSLSLVGQYFNAWNVGTPGATYSPDPDNHKNFTRKYVSVKYSGKSPQINLNWDLSYYYTWNKSDWVDPEAAWGYTDSITETTTQGIRSNLNFPTYSFGRLALGLDLDFINVESYKIPPAKPWNPNSSYKNYGVFLEESLKFERFFVLAGVRYDKFKTKLEETYGYTNLPNETKDVSAFSWRTGLKYFLNDSVALRAAIGTGFRAPMAAELLCNYKSSVYGTWIGNPDLDPEKAITYEGGVEFENENAKLELEYFFSNYKDKIVSTQLPDGNYTYINLDGAQLSGIEGNFALKFRFVRPYLNFIYYLSRKNKDENEVARLGTDTLLYVSKEQITSGVEIKYDIIKLNLNAFYVGPQKVQDWNWTSPTYGQAIDHDSFTVVNARVDVTPRIKNKIDFYLSVENLFDKYYEFVRGYPMPGRTIFFGIKGTL